MKKTIFIFLSLIFTVATNAQKPEWLFGISKDSCKIFADDAMSHFKGAYKFIEAYDADDNTGGYYYVVSYRSDSIKDAFGRPDVYGFMFRKYNIGENKALEIAGKPRYFIERIEGRFLELYPIWQAYIDANADKLKMSNDLITKKNIDNPNNSKKYAYCLFQVESESDNTWYILVRNL